MKKLTSLLLAVLMLFSVAALASCGNTETGFDYRNETLTDYVTLADYIKQKLEVNVGLLGDTITDAEVNAQIDKALMSANAYYKKITDAKDENATLVNGDTVGITFKGVTVKTLKAAKWAEDGSKNAKGETPSATDIKGLEGFKNGEATSATNLILGSGQYIEGFESGLVGKKVGDTPHH